MKIIKTVLLILVAALVVIQFFGIEKNQNAGEQPNNISKQFAVSAEVESILKTSCYDCHSNNTVYPWYASVQPVAWWLQGHVNEGKEELNFDEFAAYKPRRQFKKMDEAIELVKKGEMPLSSYTLAHGDARLSQSQKEILVLWFDGIIQELKSKNPGSAPADEEKEEGEHD